MVFDKGCLGALTSFTIINSVGFPPRSHSAAVAIELLLCGEGSGDESWLAPIGLPVTRPEAVSIQSYCCGWVLLVKWDVRENEVICNEVMCVYDIGRLKQWPLLPPSVCFTIETHSARHSLRWTTSQCHCDP